MRWFPYSLFGCGWGSLVIHFMFQITSFVSEIRHFQFKVKYCVDIYQKNNSRIYILLITYLLKRMTASIGSEAHKIGDHKRTMLWVSQRWIGQVDFSNYIVAAPLKIFRNLPICK